MLSVVCCVGWGSEIMRAEATSASRLRAEIHPDGTALSLRGFIDEHACFADLIPMLRYPLTIDLGGVERINSLGVRAWIDFITPLSAGGTVWLKRCPDVLVQQFSCVSSMLGQARVRSVLAPYLCSVCDAVDSQEVVIDEDFDPARPSRAPASKTCPECTGVSHFDEVTDSYFLFLRST
jgi:eukaryotic-like serine/threonine-protein kinase